MDDGSCDRNSENCIFYFYLLLTAVSGIIMIHLGVFALQDDRNFYHFFIGSAVHPPLIALICIGITFICIAIVFFITSFCFHIAAWRPLIVYTVFALVCLSLFDVFYAFYIEYSDFRTSLTLKFYETIHGYNVQKETRRAWNMLQTSLKCCGVEGTDDWVKRHMTPPQSCFTRTLNKTSHEWENVMARQGCKDKLFYAFINSLYLAGLETGLKV